MPGAHEIAVEFNDCIKYKMPQCPPGSESFNMGRTCWKVGSEGHQRAKLAAYGAGTSRNLLAGKKGGVRKSRRVRKNRKQSRRNRSRKTRRN